MFVLPGLDRVRVKDFPNGGAADGLVQFLPGPLGQVGGGLSAQWVAGAGDHITGDGDDNGPIEGGKRPACGPVRTHPGGETGHRPNVFATGGWSWGEDRPQPRLERWRE